MGLFSFSDVLKEVAGMINESRKLSLKNKKLMFSVLRLPLLLNGLVYLFNVFAIKPEMSTPRQLVVSSCISMTVWSFPFIIDLVSVIVIVHASALTHKDENIKTKYLLVLTLKSLKGPLITSFYIFLFTLGYTCLLSIIFSPLLLFSPSFHFLAAESGALSMLFVLFQCYLGVVWDLSMVITILEETHGIQALGKARKIVKGMRPKLFLLSVFFRLLTFGLAQIARRIDSRRSLVVTLTTGLVLVSSIFVVRMFQFVTYTVAYFQRNKRSQGKDVESLHDDEHTKLASNTLIALNISREGHIWFSLSDL